MHLRSVVGGLVERNDRCTLAVSTIGGTRKDNIKLKETESQEFSTENAQECLRQYARWKTAVSLAAKAQATDAPGERMPAGFGIQKSPRVGQFAGHIIDDFAARLERRMQDASSLVAAIRGYAAQDIFATLKQVIDTDIDNSLPKDSAPVDFRMPYFEVVNEHLEGDIKAPPLPPWMKFLFERAKVGDGQSLNELRSLAWRVGFEIGEKSGKYLPDDVRFLQLYKSSHPLFGIIDEFDLRTHFGKGLSEKMNWKHHVCLKFYGDPKNPMFTDIATTDLAAQMDVIAKVEDWGLVHLRR